MGNEEDLIELRKTIDQKKQDKTRMEGQLSEMLKRLSDDHQYDSVDVAKQNVSTMKAEREDLTVEFGERITQLKEKYPQW